MIQVSPQGAGTSFAITVNVCEEVQPLPEEKRNTLEFYPNPATSVIVSKSDFAVPENFHLQVFDLQGRQQAAEFQVVDNNLVVNISSLSPGMYILRMATPSKIYRTKVVKE